MTYAEKLRHPLWQKKRLHILERDGWKCRSCGTGEKNLQVHHVIYSRIDPWQYDDAVLQTLCEDCHKERQELSDKAADSLRIAIMDIATERMEKIARRLIKEAMSCL